jgi:hypothetical protein
VASPASRVVMYTWFGSTAKCTSVRCLKIRSVGLRSCWYCFIASATDWFVNQFFSSAVAVGMPFTNSAMSIEAPGADSL